MAITVTSEELFGGGGGTVAPAAPITVTSEELFGGREEMAAAPPRKYTEEELTSIVNAPLEAARQMEELGKIPLTKEPPPPTIGEKFINVGKRLVSYPETILQTGKGLIEAPFRTGIVLGGTAGLMAEGKSYKQARTEAEQAWQEVSPLLSGILGGDPKLEQTRKNMEGVGAVFGLLRNVGTWTDEQIGRVIPKYAEMIHYVPKSKVGRFINAVVDESMDWASAIGLFRVVGGRGKVQEKLPTTENLRRVENAESIRRVQEELGSEVERFEKRGQPQVGITEEEMALREKGAIPKPPAPKELKAAEKRFVAREPRGRPLEKDIDRLEALKAEARGKGGEFGEMFPGEVVEPGKGRPLITREGYLTRGESLGGRLGPRKFPKVEEEIPPKPPAPEELGAMEGRFGVRMGREEVIPPAPPPPMEGVGVGARGEIPPAAPPVRGETPPIPPTKAPFDYGAWQAAEPRTAKETAKIRQETANALLEKRTAEVRGEKIPPTAPSEPPFRVEGEKVGAIFNGMQDTGKGKAVALFTDKVTGSTFAVGEGQSVAKQLKKVRDRFAQKKAVKRLETAEELKPGMYTALQDKTTGEVVTGRDHLEVIRKVGEENVDNYTYGWVKMPEGRFRTDTEQKAFDETAKPTPKPAGNIAIQLEDGKTNLMRVGATTAEEVAIANGVGPSRIRKVGVFVDGKWVFDKGPYRAKVNLWGERGATLLPMDIAEMIIEKSKKVGVTIEEYLKRLGFTGEDAAVIMGAAKSIKEKEAIVEGVKLPKPTVAKYIPSAGIHDTSTPYQTGDIVKQRNLGSKEEPLLAPAVTANELAVVGTLKNLPFSPHYFNLETRPTTFERLGRDANELFRRPAMKAQHNLSVELQETEAKIKTWGKWLSSGARKRVGVYLIGQRAQGNVYLEKMGLGKIKELEPNEMKVANAISADLGVLFDRLQDARARSGLAPFRKVENYITFFEDLSEFQRMGIDITKATTESLDAARVHMRSTPFRFLRARPDIYLLKTDALDIYKMYAQAALRHINIGPEIAKGRELINDYMDAKGKVAFSLRESAPNTYRFLSNFYDAMAGQKVDFHLPRWVEKGLAQLTSNLAVSTLGGNVRSAAIQPTALLSACVELGPKYTAEGIADLFSPGKRKTSRRESDHLLGRQFDVSVMNVYKDTVLGKVGKVAQGAKKVSMFPLAWLDQITAQATWNGALRKGLAKGMSERTAVNYADDVTIRTQASASMIDRAPIQEHVLGRAMTVFQTFVIANWSFLKRHVAGMGNAEITNFQAFKKAMTVVGGMTLINMLFKNLNTQSPFPEPITAYKEKYAETGSKVSALTASALEIAQIAPIVGGLRFGSTPLGAVIDYTSEVARKVGGRPAAKPYPELIGKGGGLPLTVQAAKSYRALKRGATPLESVFATKPQAKGRNIKEALKGLY
jgi:hypothetical protein